MMIRCQTLRETQGGDLLWAAWFDADSMRVLADVLLERGLITPEPAEVIRSKAAQYEAISPEDLALFDLEVLVREYILEKSGLSERCPQRIELPLIRRPGNALNVEIGTPLPRCRCHTPEDWGANDPRGARWLASGGSGYVFGTCSRAACPLPAEPIENE
jgi:hypothetical protein